MPGPGDASLRSCVVLLDTSASMNQRTASNLSLLDIAKAGIEQMVRRFPNNLKFLLVTTRNGGTLESGWLDSQDDFLAKVKNIVARDLSNLPVAQNCSCASVAFQCREADVMCVATNMLKFLNPVLPGCTSVCV